VIVLDASVVIEILRPSPIQQTLDRRFSSGEVSLHAPHLLALEVAQGLRRLVARSAITAHRGTLALRRLADLSLITHDHDLLLDRVWELRDNLTAYDAVYVALAEALDAPLLTCDARMASAPGHRARIELLAV
jgi:predicted nucleic acid-binding protein